MRRGFITCFLMILLPVAVWSQTSPQALFDEANTALEEGKLMPALQQYRAIAASGEVSGALYLNMGIVSVQLDSMGLAKFYFLKASEFSTTQEEASKALDYVNEQFSRQSAKLPKLPWETAIQWINETPGASGIFISGFLLIIGALVMLYLHWFQLLSLNKTPVIVVSLLIAGSCLAGLSFYADYVEYRYDEAVLVHSSSRVLQSPNPESTLVSIAYEGYDLTVDHWKSDEVEGWLYIRLGNGQFGWIPDEGIRIL